MASPFTRGFGTPPASGGTPSNYGGAGVPISPPNNSFLPPRTVPSPPPFQPPVSPPSPPPAAPPSVNPVPSSLGGGLLRGLGGAGLLLSAPQIFGDAAKAVSFLGSLGGAIVFGRLGEFAKEQNRSPTTPPRSTPDSLSRSPFTGGQDPNASYNVYTKVQQKNTGSPTNDVVVDGFFQGRGAISNLKVINNIPLSDGRFFRQVQWFGIRGDGSRQFLGGSTGTVPAANEPDADLIEFRVQRSDGRPDTGGDPAAQGGNPNGAGNFQPSREIYYRGGIPNLGGAKSSAPPITKEPDNRTTRERSLDQLSGKSPFPRGIAPVTNTGSSSNESNTDKRVGGIVGGSGSSPAPSQITIIPSTSPIPNTGFPNIQPAPQGEPVVKPTTDPNTPPKRDTTPPEPRPPEPQLNQNEILKDIQQKSRENNNLLQQLPFLLPLAFIANQAFNDRQKANAKDAVCDASNPNGCVDNAVKRNTDQVGDKVDAGNRVRDVNDAAQTGLLTSLLTALASFRTWVEKAFNNTIVDKAIAALTLMATIHNAAMLTTSIKDTLFEAISQGLAAVGIKSPEGSPIDINSAVNGSVENLLKGILGAQQYEGLKLAWQKANRTIQAGAAIVNTTRSLYDSTRSLNELTGNNVGRIGNALKKDGVVSENAYRSMSENNNQINATMEKLQRLEDTVSTLSSITSEAYNIRENVDQLTKNREDFDKAVKELPPKEQIENLAVKAKENAERTASQSPIIPLTELVKPDV